MATNSPPLPTEPNMKSPTRLFVALGVVAALAACTVPSQGASGPVGLLRQTEPQAPAGVSRPEHAASRISGIVNMRGMGGAAGVEVQVYGADSAPQMPHWMTRTDAAGRFEVAVPEGRYNVLVRRTGSNLAAARFGVQANTVLDIDLVPTGSITGKVRLEPAGDPLGVDVFVPGTGLVAKADADGAFTLTDVPVGAYRLVAARQGFALVWSDSVAVEASSVRSMPVLVLAARAERIALQGVVRGEVVQLVEQNECWPRTIAPSPSSLAQELLADVLVTAHHLDGTVATASSDASGRFTIPAFPLGIVAYRFNKPGFFDEWQDAVYAPRAAGLSERSVSAVLRPKTLALHGERRPMALGESRQVGLFYVATPTWAHVGEDPYVYFQWRSSDPAVLTVNRGVVTAVGTGSSVLTVEDPEEPSRKATMAIAVQSTRPDQLLARVEGLSGEPASGINMSVLNAQGTVRATARADADGGLQSTALCPGTYRWSWEDRTGQLGYPWLASYRSEERVVAAGDEARAEIPMRLKWAWASESVDAAPRQVEPGATLSVSFAPYEGATEYALQVLSGGADAGIVAQATASTSPIEVAMPKAAGGYGYRLSFSQTASGGFSGQSALNPLEVVVVASGLQLLDADLEKPWPQAVVMAIQPTGLGAVALDSGYQRRLLPIVSYRGDLPADQAVHVESMNPSIVLAERVGQVWILRGVGKGSTQVRVTSYARGPDGPPLVQEFAVEVNSRTQVMVEVE